LFYVSKPLLKKKLKNKQYLALYRVDSKS